MNGRKTFAYILIGFGVFLLLVNFLPVNLDNLFWPSVLVVLGLVLIFRPEVLAPKGVKTRPIADIHRSGDWEVQDEEIRMFVGDVDYDFTTMQLPDGETVVRISAFVPDIDFRVPADAGLKVVCSAFVVDSKVNGEKKDYVMSGYNYTSPNFDSAAKKVTLRVNCFVADLKVEHV